MHNYLLLIAVRVEVSALNYNTELLVYKKKNLKKIIHRLFVKKPLTDIEN